MLGSTVNNFEGLFSLIIREHMFHCCFPGLRQHLLECEFSDPRELAKEADLWVSTRGSGKVLESDPAGSVSGSPQPRAGEVHSSPDSSQCSRGGERVPCPF